ncbi:hypothetical protein F4780DRAFT_787615 [Xylariomycetidae sp. FL0641]|nr:hypothetical protein F4780DRAFT_787615 [Xylariomycetidae sp. FL0641]
MMTIEPIPSITEEFFDASDELEHHIADGEPATPTWKGKGKAVLLEGTDPVEGFETQTNKDSVDWRTYEPPAGLTDIASFDDIVLVGLVSESIERVKARIVAEKESEQEQQKQERYDQQATAEEEEQAAVFGKTREESPADTASPDDQRQVISVSVLSEGSRDASPTPPQRRPKKRTFMGLFKRDDAGRRRGESSALGATYAKRYFSSSNIDLSTHAARKHECVSCLDDFPASATVQTPCHRYCTACFAQLIHTACTYAPQWPPKCCLNPLPSSLILSHTTGTVLSTYRARLSTSTSSLSSSSSPAPADLRALAAAEGWQPCPGCGVLVEHAAACQHMTCALCGAHFCYVCGAPWRSCACTAAQLARVKDGAAARRLRRAEDARLARVRASEAARRGREREERRREGVARRYAALRAAAGRLHARQRRAVGDAHARAEAGIRAQGDGSLRALRARHGAARAALGAATAAQVRARREAAGREGAARAAEERGVEARYRAALGAYWAGRGGGGAREAERALAAFRRRMDAGAAAWRRWTDREVAGYVYRVREEQAIREELMEEAERRLVRTSRKEEAACGRRRGAELRWVREVVEERERMLAEMESREMAEGEGEGEGESGGEWSAGEQIDTTPDEAQWTRESDELRIPGAFV